LILDYFVIKQVGVIVNAHDFIWEMPGSHLHWNMICLSEGFFIAFLVSSSQMLGEYLS
jgi:hypothetical protein